MRVIDAHVHLYPSELNRDPAGWAAAHGEARWAALCTRRRRDGRAVQTFPGVDDLLREMDRAGVGRAILLGWYWEQPATCAWHNRFMAECVAAHPDRLAAFATVHPGAGTEATLQELHGAREAGLAGIGELSPHAQGFAVADDVFREVLALAADWNWPVNLHVTDPESRDHPGRVATPLEDFVRLALEFPKTRFVLAHWGGLLPLRDETVRALGNLCYDTAASPLLYEQGVWSRFASVVPDDRVVFGSDFPLNLYPKLDAEPQMWRLVAEATAARASDAVMRGNAERWLTR